MPAEGTAPAGGRCVVCGGEVRIRRYLVAGELVYARCGTCGLIVQDPLPGLIELGEIYRAYFHRRTSLRGRSYGYADYDRERSPQHFRTRYLPWLRRHAAPDGGRFLDFGCGTGNLVQVLRAEGYDAHGYEFSQEAIAELRARGIPFFTSAELQTTSTRFRYLSMLDVIEHLHDPARDLRRIGALMEEGGILFVETVNADDLFARYIYKERWQGITPVHLYLFGESTVRRLLGEHGFEIIDVHTYKMSGGLLARVSRKTASYALAGAWPLIERRGKLLGYSAARLRRFAESERRSPIQLSLGDGLRVVARKR